MKFSIQRLKTNDVGFAPKSLLVDEHSVEANSWFVPDVNRRDAEKMLTVRKYPNGTYLIRQARGGNFGISNFYFSNRSKTQTDSQDLLS